MKREIKFRAWDKNKKCFLPITPYKWIDGVCVANNKPQKQALNTFEISETNCDRQTGKSMFLTFDGELVNLHPLSENTTQSLLMSDIYILMQYTGLKDKNGKEIYEGDIVHIEKDKFGKGVHEVWTVEYDESTASFIVYNQLNSLRNFDNNVHLYIDVCEGYAFIPEVIGNIYENPGLL